MHSTTSMITFQWQIFLPCLFISPSKRMLAMIFQNGLFFSNPIDLHTILSLINFKVPKYSTIRLCLFTFFNLKSYETRNVFNN